MMKRAQCSNPLLDSADNTFHVTRAPWSRVIVVVRLSRTISPTAFSTMPLHVVYASIVAIFSLAIGEGVWPRVLSDMPGTSAGGVTSLLSVS